MFTKSFGTLVGTIMGASTVGLIVWMVGVKAQLWKAASGGFWLF
ncbi:MAG TPA: hypothetical protein VMS64_31115 [Candidatus Methylomirabilis sp.]|nr:hypothetical protein [Candidatus Methylomirabilis sp.]